MARSNSGTRSRRVFAIIGVVAATLAAGSTRAERLPLSDNLVDLRTTQGQQWFLEADAREAYWPLAAEFVSQKNGAFCGVATLVMVLNSLETPAPALPGVETFASFTQDNVFDARTEAIVTQEKILRRGMTLDELGGLFARFGLTAKVVHASQSSLDAFRSAAVEQLSTKKRHVVVNYLRSSLGQLRGGHISPLAAYDGKTDRFLVLDVARFKYPPVWIKAAELFDAMSAIDEGNEGRSRGFILVGPSEARSDNAN
jgi:hypothetical protein